MAWSQGVCQYHPSAKVDFAFFAFSDVSPSRMMGLVYWCLKCAQSVSRVGVAPDVLPGIVPRPDLIHALTDAPCPPPLP